jgi:hypothetical protein
MTSALGGLLGGSNPLSSVMNIASMVFPQAAIANAVMNIGSQIIGDVVKQATSQLGQEAGMPKFVQDIVKQVVDQVLGQNHKPTDSDCEKKCKDSGGDWIQNFVEELAKSLADAVKDGMDKDGKCEGGGKGGKGGKATGGSWLVALARALGEVAGDKAAKMVELSDKLTQLNDEGKGLEKGSTEQQTNAKESTATQNELNGVSKEFSQFMETINNVVKGIGDGLTSVARK